MSAREFSHFPAETLQFLSELDADNSKDWFEAHRDLYEAGYVGPARAFVETIGPRLKKISPSVRFEPKVNGSIARINRDIRFSRDKSPYKNHLDIWFWHGEKKGWDRPGFYLRITPAYVFLGSGMHTFEGAMLDRYRQAALDERSGKGLAAALAKVKKSGPYEIGGMTRKTVPRGFDAGHERAHFLLHEGLYAGVDLPADEAVKPGFVELALKHFSATWPLGQWILDEVVAA
jgi:uncharacterized protein (TIGR02453 family)